MPLTAHDAKVKIQTILGSLVVDGDLGPKSKARFLSFKGREDDFGKGIIAQVQKVLGAKPDGDLGHVTEAKFDGLAHYDSSKAWPPVAGEDPNAPVREGNIIKGQGKFDWLQVEIDGDDLVIKNAHGTAFGGSNDKMDNGETSSGIWTKTNPTLQAVSLPMNHPGVYDRKYGYVLKNSPIPMCPFALKPAGNGYTQRPGGLWVQVTADDDNGKEVKLNLPVIELGPANWTKHAIDFTVPAARNWDFKATANNCTVMCKEVRLLGAAKRV